MGKAALPRADSFRNRSREGTATTDARLSLAEQHRAVLDNRGVIFSVGRRYYTGRMPDDAVQECEFALVEAATKFDPTLGIKFGTYAAWWVRAYILRHEMNSKGAVRAFSSNEGRAVFCNLGRAMRKLGGEPTTAEIAAAIGCSERAVTEALPRLATGSDESLDDGRDWLASRASTAPPVDEVLDDARRARIVRRVVSRLPPRERDVITRGFLRRDPETLKAIGERWGVSRERARQIEARALDKLRLALASLDGGG